MGRNAKREHLNIYMNGHPVGTWGISAQGEHSLVYEESWINSLIGRPISLSLPLQKSHRGEKVEAYFDNLLPDSNEIRKRIQNRFSSGSASPFNLLKEIGRDCIGAIQLLPDSVTPEAVNQVKGRPVNEAEIEHILSNVQAPLTGFNRELDNFRISIAGVQEKTSFCRLKNQWLIPSGIMPTTHIFKLPIGSVGPIDMSTSVENEWLCSLLLKAFGIPCAETEMARFGDQKCLIVTRFDRRVENGSIIRLPQEDLCQAMGIVPGRKYESDGGPGIVQIMDLLRSSDDSKGDRRRFFKIQILFWLLGAIDGHGKNYSIFLGPKGRYSMTPAYDVLSAYPVLGKKGIAEQKLKMALSVSDKNRNYKWFKIGKRHWYATGRQAGLTEKIVDSIVEEIIGTAEKSFDDVYNHLPEDVLGSVGEPIRYYFFTTLEKLKDTPLPD